MSARRLLPVKPVIPGPCTGEVVLISKYLSFFGEVDPERGCTRGEQGVCFAGKVLVFPGSRGSTVGPYVIYALRKAGVAPICMIVEEVEPMLVAGCVLGEIPLYKTIGWSIVELEGVYALRVVECKEGLHCVEPAI
jgi:predicted aconitase with swiveling domain